MLLVAEEGVLIPGVTGPLMKLHAPVPTLGTLAAMVAVPEETQADSVLPALDVVGGCTIVMETVALDAVQGLLLIVQRSTTGPVPLVCVKVEEPLAALLNVPEPPLTMLQAPVPTPGVLPPSAAVVLLAQIVCVLPTVAVVGGGVIVMLTSAVLAVQGLLLMVQRNAVTVPEVCVNVAPGVVALGLKVPAPPPMMLHAPVPTLGVLPPKATVVPPVQIVCAPPTVAVVGRALTVTVVKRGRV